MIDYIKAIYTGNDEGMVTRLSNHPDLDFKSLLSVKSGEIHNKKVADLDNLKFTIFDNKHLLLKGSLHKFANDGLHNYSDFTFSDLNSTLQDLETNYLGNLCNWTLQNIEFGVNINKPAYPSELFFNSTLLHKTKPFSPMGRNNPIGIECYHNQYGIKIYSKKLQYKLQEDIMRTEIKTTRMHYLRHHDVVSLADLTCNHKLKQLGILLPNCIDDLLFIDYNFPEANLPRKHKNLIHNSKNPRFWSKLHTTDYKRFNYIRKQYKILLADYYPDNPQSYLKEAVTQKWQYLLSN
jgi:hypothetical protein